MKLVIGGFVLVVIFFTGFLSWAIYDDYVAYKEKTDINRQWLKENDNTVNVLTVTRAEYDLYVIVEGSKTKERQGLYTKELVVPNDVWLMKAKDRTIIFERKIK